MPIVDLILKVCLQLRGVFNFGRHLLIAFNSSTQLHSLCRPQRSLSLSPSECESHTHALHTPHTHTHIYVYSVIV